MACNNYKYILHNSVLGLAPLFLFNVLTIFLPFNTAMMAGYLFNIILMAGGAIPLVRLRVYSFTITASFFVLTTQCVLMITPWNDLFKLIPNLTSEMLLFIVLAVVLSNEERFVRYVNFNFKPTVRADIRTSLLRLYHLSRILLVIYGTHLMVIILYLNLPQIRGVGRDMFIFHYFAPLVLLLITAYEQVRIHFIFEHEKKERFVYVVDEQGTAIGKVAYSDAIKGGSAYCNPYVRLAIVQRGMIYLHRRSANDVHEPNSVDLPLGDYVNFNESLNGTVERLLEPTTLSLAQVSYVMRHHQVGEQNNRLIFLGVIILEDEEQMPIDSKSVQKGKFWTQKQIEEEMQSSIFATSFVQEYQTIKSHILNRRTADL